MKKVFGFILALIIVALILIVTGPFYLLSSLWLWRWADEKADEAYLVLCVDIAMIIVTGEDNY